MKGQTHFQCRKACHQSICDIKFCFSYISHTVLETRECLVNIIREKLLMILEIQITCIPGLDIYWQWNSRLGKNSNNTYILNCINQTRDSAGKKAEDNFVLKKASSLAWKFQCQLIWKWDAGGGSGIFKKFLRDHNILV